MNIKVNKYGTKDKVFVNVVDKHCKNKHCFKIHNYNYILSNGKVVNNWMCRTRELYGCPIGDINYVC